MKKLFGFLGIMALAMVVTVSCYKEGSDDIKSTYDDSADNVMPTAYFDANTNGDLTLTFSNLSADASSYLWEFGDGFTSSSKNPSHTYSTYGSKTVTLTARNKVGLDTYSKSFYLTQPTGKLILESTSKNPYEIYIDGSYKRKIEGYGNYTFELSPGNHTVRVLQVSGYLFYPTDETYSINITAGYVTTKYFPESKNSEGETE